MNDELIASDAPLDDAQCDILAALADTLVPASDDGAMPSAKELDLAGHLARYASDFLPALAEILARFDDGFVSEPLNVRCEQLQAFSEAEPESFGRLLAEVYGCYYQDARVLAGIGVGAGPPFPRGNTVEPGDLSLLDPVLANPTGWRRDVT